MTFCHHRYEHNEGNTNFYISTPYLSIIVPEIFEPNG